MPPPPHWNEARRNGAAITHACPRTLFVPRGPLEFKLYNRKAYLLSNGINRDTVPGLHDGERLSFMVFFGDRGSWRKMLPNSRSQLSCGAVLSVSGSAPTHKVGSEVNNAMFKLGLLVQACLTADKNGCPF